MFSTFWFLCKVILSTIILMEILAIGGSISFAYADYHLSTSIGLFAVISLLCLWVLSVFFRGVRAVLNAPRSLVIYNEKNNHKKGMQALAYGLSAVAAGDVRMAKYYTKRTRNYLKNDFGLSHLLGGLTARLDKDTPTAHRSYEALLNRSETSFLGLKGLMQVALDKGDKRYARVLAEKAYKKNPKQPWILQFYYELEVQSKNYAEALALLKKIESHGIWDKDKITSDRVALFMAMNKIDKAYKISSTSLPVSLSFLQKLAEKDKRRKSIGIIQDIWAVNPHPQIIDFWIKYAPKKAIGNSQIMAAWIEDLFMLNRENAASALYCGDAMIKIGQVEMAKRMLQTAINIKPTIRSYQLMHQIDPIGGWMNNIPHAHSDQCWICTETLKIYPAWQANNSDDHFNTIEWNYPDNVSRQPVNSRATALDHLL